MTQIYDGQKASLTSHPVSPHAYVTLGYRPSWVYRVPPGVGDAPQFVYDTYAAAVYSIEGPGDVILDQRRIFARPSFIGQQYLKSGLPTTAGTVWSSPLTFAPVSNNPAQQQYPGFSY